MFLRGKSWILPKRHVSGFVSTHPNSSKCQWYTLRQYRTKSVWGLCTPSACKFPFRACFVSSRTHLACIFSEIFRENTRKSTKDFLRFSLHLSKNLTTQSAYVRYETDSHISQKCSWIHQVFTPLFVSSDEKFDDASVAQSLCGIAYDFSCCYTLKTLMDTGSESILLEILGCRVCIFQENAVFPWWSPSKKVE